MRISVLHDIFRSSALGVISCVDNARWIEALLRRAVADLPVTITRFAGQADGGSIDEAAVLRDVKLPATPEGWAALTNAPDLQFISELQSLFDTDFAVGFGLTPALIKAFAARNIPVLDIEISPLRFGPSLPFRARTSAPGLSASLHEINIDTATFASAAQSHIGRAAALNDPRDYTGTWGLFCGQTQLDLALIVDGKLTSPEQDEYFEQIRSLARSVDIFHVAPHPFTAEQPSHLRRLFGEIPNAVPAERSTYSYLASGQLSFVSSLSSSVLSEAPWFGVPAKRILTADRDNVQGLPFGLSAWTDVDGRLFAKDLWSAFFHKIAYKPSIGQVHINPADVRFGGNLGGHVGDTGFLPLPRLANDCRNLIAPNVPNAAMMRAGWHNPESWGRWSSNEFASLMFRSETDAPLDVVLESHPFMDIEVQARPFGETRFTPLEFEGPPHDLKAVVRVKPSRPDRICGIVFRTPVNMSPSLFDSPDTRRLGLALRAVTVHEAGSEQHINTDGRARQVMSADYYRLLHSNVAGFQENNWLLPYAEMVRKLAPRTLVECGCGNGAFLSAVSDRVESLIGLDWAGSSKFPSSTRGIRFQPWDALSNPPPNADFLCSADFLEHMPPERVDDVLRRMFAAAPKQLHVVACYDDLHSHLTIEPPERWLERFQAIDNSFFIFEERERNGGRKTVSLANFPTPTT